jgi:alanyl-tRNA synthetase
LLKEEEQFAKTLEQGLKLLEGELAQLKGSVIPGEVVLNCMILTVSQLT